ncbi:hypothetical protein [Mycobacterium phage Maco7]|nr:hypothetical protein [Mycobacterium phage Maco7]
MRKVREMAYSYEGIYCDTLEELISLKTALDTGVIPRPVMGAKEVEDEEQQVVETTGWQVAFVLNWWKKSKHRNKTVTTNLLSELLLEKYPDVSSSTAHNALYKGQEYGLIERVDHNHYRLTSLAKEAAIVGTQRKVIE